MATVASQKQGSLRYKSRPTPRIPFRDDTGLVAFRYEQTTPAEPPILIPPPRNPLRRTTRSYSSSPSSPASPVVVTPPPVAPTEQHPALRTSAGTAPPIERWKRDSGVATTTASSSITIREECEGDPLYRKTSLGPTTPITYCASASIAPSSGQCTPEELPRASQQSCWSVSSGPDSEAVTAKPSAARRLVKSLSLRTGSSSTSKRLRRKSTSEVVMAAPQSRGSLHPKSPKSPKFPGGASADPSLKKRPGSDTSLFSAEAQGPNAEFTPITTNIPSVSLLDDDFLARLTFSKRGSVMFGGKRAVDASASAAESSMAKPSEDEAVSPAVAPSQPAAGTGSDATRGATDSAEAQPHQKAPLPNIRLLPIDTERESQKVRSLYESGDSLNWEDGAPDADPVEHLEPPVEVSSEGEEGDVSTKRKPATRTLPSHGTDTPRPASSYASRRDNRARKQYELAGGIEDWEGLQDADVDRYGFITVRRPVSRASTPEARVPQTPRRRSGRNILTKRDPSLFPSPLSLARIPSRKVSARSLNTHNSEVSNSSRRTSRSPIRAAANLLPHNRNRRWMDEAGDMLSLPAGLADIAEEQQIEQISEALKKKEIERSEKWRKMAKVIKPGKEGEGMEFEFDTKNQKLIDRTWKGIPDRWRAAAWYSFLSTSAKTAGSSATDEQIIADFHRLQKIGSQDDIQIDLDVPRTINRHIMFRRRYRGGQRLLFRVLHAVSLYFPDTGYVQGMAGLAATLLCYYDEERCFVMLVRMWQLRGLERLYQPGFAGLMTALKDLETRWLGGKQAAKKLSELDIDPTAYGTRWYLTLFNLSIPFAAQLRVWDVFMLLGDPAITPSQFTPEPPGSGEDAPFPGLEILHATSAALIDALDEVLVDADFENAMKALTSAVPVKDEDLLMKVVRAEWKHHHKKKA